ncbi:hypothetical protein LINPERPRIM_LOCUS16407, partial [Linum perenne]
FDFYKLAFQWPLGHALPKAVEVNSVPSALTIHQNHGFCFANKCRSSIPDPNALKIHGLWPTNESPPYNPKPKTGDIDWTSQKLQLNLTNSHASRSFREAMRSKWPQLLTSQTNMDFWLQENRHGKVSELTPPRLLPEGRQCSSK